MTIDNMPLSLKTRTSNGISNTGRLLYHNEDIVFEYFRLIKKKDIERLINLFSPNAIIYEPFSKLRGGLKGKQAIESFLKIVIMANDSLKHHITIENSSDVKNRSNIGNNDNDNRNNNKNNSISSHDKVIIALVIFEKGDSVKARFTFGLSSDDDNYNDNNNRDTNSKYNNKIMTLHIQFIE